MTVSYSPRDEARLLGLTRYRSGPCKHGHDAERLVSNGACLDCARLKNNKRNLRSVISRAGAAALRDQAKEAGQTRFNTGRPCKYGHLADRMVSSGRCIVCLIASNRARDKADPSGPARRKKRYRERHPEKASDGWKSWAARYPEKYAAAQKKSALRWERRMATALRIRINGIFRGKIRTGSAVRDLGCTITEFVAHIEALFIEGMTRENYGAAWELDHKIPLSSFNLRDPEQFRAACHYSNIQPLLIAAHLEKTRNEQRKAA